MQAWSCITSYPLRGLPYLAYDNVNPAMVNGMMLRSSMLAFEKVYRLITAYLLLRVNLDKIMHVRWDFDASSAQTQRWVHWTSIKIEAQVHYFV